MLLLVVVVVALVRAGGYPKMKKTLEEGWEKGRSASPPMHSLQGMHCEC